MPPLLWTMIGVCLAITIGSPFLIALVLLLVPGRKGKMRAERHVIHDEMDPQQAKALYAARLARDGFDVRVIPNALQLRAFRHGAAVTETQTHGEKGIVLEMMFTPQGRGVCVDVAAWMQDFVFYDTGESRFVNLTVARLLHSDLDHDAPPVVPNISFMAMSAAVAATLSVAVIILLSTKPLLAEWQTVAVVRGAVLACIASLFMARQATQQMHRRPEELRGRGLAWMAVATGILGAAGGAAALVPRATAARACDPVEGRARFKSEQRPGGCGGRRTQKGPASRLLADVPVGLDDRDNGLVASPKSASPKLLGCGVSIVELRSHILHLGESSPHM